jgi:hypothetical protein
MLKFWGFKFTKPKTFDKMTVEVHNKSQLF